ncbi:MAG: S8 family serine peptidase [Gemmatimonadales bacterium]|nr:S8 family serine peptidase [Gemmatimonadales bacterium]
MITDSVSRGATEGLWTALEMARNFGPIPLMVISAGNDSRDAKMSGYPRLRDSFPTQVIVVGASSPRVGSTRSRWGGPNFTPAKSSGSNWGTLIDVYAPGEGVGFYNDPTAAFRTGTGASLSAPIVSGIAALLLSFDSTLTSAQLKDLIIQGAAAGGRSIQNDPTKFLVNAYESLKLAGASSGKRICDAPSAYELDGAGGYRVVVKRQGGDDVLPLSFNPLTQYFYELSVAPSGSAFATTRIDNDPSLPDPIYLVSEIHTLSNGVWTTQDATGVSERMYLERDTVDVVHNEIGSTAVVRGPNAKNLGDLDVLVKRLSGVTYADYQFLSFSPDGKYLLVGATIRKTPCTAVVGATILFTVSTLAPTLVTMGPCISDDQYFPRRPLHAAWGPYSDRFVVAEEDSSYTTGTALHYIARTIVGGAVQINGADQEIAGRNSSEHVGIALGALTFPGRGRMNPTGTLMYRMESTPADCRRTGRSATSPFAIVTDDVFNPWAPYPCYAATVPYWAPSMSRATSPVGVRLPKNPRVRRILEQQRQLVRMPEAQRMK